MVALRLPGFVAGFSAMFIVVLVAGNAFGPAFGFLLGAVGTFASGLFIGGLGPWLPFQMVAVGWVGAGAASCRTGRLGDADRVARRLRRRERLPVRRGDEPVVLAVPGRRLARSHGTRGRRRDEPAPLPRVLRRRRRSCGTRSAPWATRCSSWSLGRPLLGALDRAARRMRLDVHDGRHTGPTIGRVR